MVRGTRVRVLYYHTAIHISGHPQKFGNNPNGKNYKKLSSSNLKFVYLKKNQSQKSHPKIRSSRVNR